MNVKIIKKILIICCVLTGFCATFYSGSFVNKNFDVCIHISYNLDITDDLNDIVNDQLDSLEEENFDDILDNLTKEQQGIVIYG